MGHGQPATVSSSVKPLEHRLEHHSVTPDTPLGKGTGELGTFFYDSERNLIGIAQPVGESRIPTSKGACR
jgi:hypothetical protein